MDKNKLAGIIVTGLCLASFVAILFIPAIPQDPGYHQFIDSRIFLNIPNFSNVASNIPFLLVGLLGVAMLLKNNRLHVSPQSQHYYLIFFIAVSAVAAGSAYYHIAPDNHTLLWDRLPMAVGFMALFSIVIAEYISADLARKLFIPLLIAGISSVIYWHFTELENQGDLRFYILTQFLPMTIIPLILVLYRKPYAHTKSYVYLIAGYFCAKLFEHFDAQVFEFTGQFISGHSMKHIAAATGILLMIYFHCKRSATTS